MSLEILFLFSLFVVAFGNSKDVDQVIRFYYIPIEGYSSNVNLPNVGMNIDGISGKDCQDYMGRPMTHGMHYVPVGADMCKLCICDNGVAKSCRDVLCTPPTDCRSFKMGLSCCEFICLDDQPPGPIGGGNAGTFFTFTAANQNSILIIASALTPTLIISCCFIRCCYRKHRVRVRELETEQANLERDGLVHFNAFLKICNKEGKKLKSGDIGEIYMKFEFGFLRCYNELPEAMRHTMDSEGFYRTGDIGYTKKGVTYILDKNRYISDRRNSNMRCSRF